ncbi:5-hydroxytryptamine receptor 1F-like [Actinia tenebrosa]|uniref:5-hydroxytryptamine receptor 1F-like n=1 Tax=Actinia tenebrosa TaxID=6105 RepID=A0A6P8IL46_ACTTE|nr:5-hydroxytryptamine receptor 1F-like [Actinia tenebrosa]
MAYVHHSIADVNTTVTCVLTHQFFEVFIKTLPYSLTATLCVLNAVLAVISTLLNLLIMAAIISTPKLRKPSFVLLCNLALTDFAVGITFGPIEVAYLITRAVGHYSSFCTIWKVLTITGFFLCSASMYTLTAISYDRYLSVAMSVKYRTIVTKKKAYYTVIVIWVFSAMGTSLIGIMGKEAYLVLVCCVMALNMVVIVDCYLLSFSVMKQQETNRPASLLLKSKSEPNLSAQKINNRLSATLKRLSDYDDRSSGFNPGKKTKESEEPGNESQNRSSWTRNRQLAVLEVRCETKTEQLKVNNLMVKLDDEANQIQNLPSPRKTTVYKLDDVQSFKNSQHTILVIVVFLFLCYLPFLIVSILISSHMINSGVSKNLAAIMVYANSSINAVIMCTRISAIRISCWRIVRKICKREN